MTLVATAPTGPRLTAPEPNWRGQQGPADRAQISRSEDQQRAILPWVFLVGGVALSLGSNVFAVLQLGATSRSIGGVIYGAWPTLAFLAAAWLWHREGRRGRVAGLRGPWHYLLVWTMRVAVAVPAAYVSLLHVHETALHFGQPGTMSWAEAVGMEAVTALALVEIDAGHLLRPAQTEFFNEGQALADAAAVPAPVAAEDKHGQAEEDEHGQAEEDGKRDATKRRAIEAALQRDLEERGAHRPPTVYAAEHGVSRQYANRIINQATGAAA